MQFIWCFCGRFISHYRCNVSLVYIVGDKTSDLLNSCEYAVGGYSDEISAYLACGGADNEYQFTDVTDDMTDVCDMCGRLLPPVTDEHLRQKHVQVTLTSRCYPHIQICHYIICCLHICSHITKIMWWKFISVFSPK